MQIYPPSSVAYAPASPQGEAFLRESFRIARQDDEREQCCLPSSVACGRVAKPTHNTKCYLPCSHSVRKASPRGEAVALATDEGGSICTCERHTLSLRTPLTNRARSRTLQRIYTSPADKKLPPSVPAAYKAKQIFAMHGRVRLGEVLGRSGRFGG